jgi:hypothetical protein
LYILLYYHNGSKKIITIRYGDAIFAVAEPLLMGFCEFVGEGLNQVHCLTSLDNQMVMMTYKCSFDGGPPQPCKELRSYRSRIQQATQSGLFDC